MSALSSATRMWPCILIPPTSGAATSRFETGNSVVASLGNQLNASSTYASARLADGHTRRSGIEAVGPKLVRSERDADRERRSLADFTFGDQRTAVQFDELLDQRKTNAGSLE